MRTIIEVPDEVIHKLDQLGELKQRSRAAIIREAISLYLEQKAVRDEDDGAFGLWKSRGLDSLQYEESVRSDWQKN